MNILLYSHSFLPKIGGRELVVYHLAHALAGLGHQVRVVGPRLDLLHTQPADFGVAIHRYPRLVRGHLRDRKSRLGALKEREMMSYLMWDIMVRGADLIHAHTTYPTGFVATLAKRWMPRIPLVITPHGIDINTIPPNFGMRLNPQISEKITRALCAAEAITAISDGIAQSIADAGAPLHKIHRIANGTDLARFANPPRGSARNRFGLTPDDKIILTVGNYHPRKGQADVIRAMPTILSREPRARLVVVGGGTDPLRAVATQAGVEKQVVLTGTVPVPFNGDDARTDDLLAELYAECAVYVSASNSAGAEGLSLAIVDAMAAGRPVVATRISGNEDVVSHENTGFLVEPGDRQTLATRIAEVLSNQALATRMGDAGRRSAADFSWRSVAKQYLQVYEIVTGFSAMPQS